MNIEIANRLVNLRKTNNYSQETLAEKLGISRQAVSKWERAEASPDTDNLILLARIYGVSLDELLATDDEISRPDSPSIGSPDIAGNENNENGGGQASEEQNKKGEYVHIGLNGVHVRDKDGSEVHVGWSGVHVDDRKKNDKVDIDKDGVFVNGEPYDHDWLKGHYRQKFPVALLIVLAYIIMGVFFDLWHPGWILFLLIPVWYTFVEAIYKKNGHIFAYPVLATIIFLLLGFYGGVWHPGWIIFLTIPLYYSLVAYLREIASNRKNSNRSEGSNGDLDE